ncbi:hypothetical protein RchiOBHm_Chr2g0173891 [Rosa chinensis]|uniref:Uncharacterized protein n=1 Tax=Rosa chinensis TaxID=74649 RepID=A0A2P6S5Z7_ROSCH|nr:hypothetical protein RchiOBHm_Chr2g0173891 [Rosa chinensis]
MDDEVRLVPFYSINSSHTLNIEVLIISPPPSFLTTEHMNLLPIDLILKDT